jgi:hypothetical protein
MSKKPSTIRIGRRYRANRLSLPYDVLVIGSGIGGLTAAACLAKMGKKVCVLEQHYTAGGFTHSYDRNGYEWDVGVHYIGDMGSSATMGRRLFDYITDGELKWEPMADHFDRIFLGDEHYDLVAGKAEYRNALVKAFPDEEQAIDTYLSYMREVKSGIRLHTLSKVLPGPLASAVANYKARKVPPYFNATTREVLESLTSNQKLIAVLTGQWGDNGLPPAQSSFIIHSMIAQHYMYGGYYPIGGASRMAQTIIPVVQQAGGEVFTYASVEKILVEVNSCWTTAFHKKRPTGNGCRKYSPRCPVFVSISGCGIPQITWDYPKPICGFIPVNITKQNWRLSKLIRMRTSPWFMYPFRPPRIPALPNGIRGGRPSRLWRPGHTPGLLHGRTSPGVSGGMITRR